jgi:hypothetical protein
MSKGRGQIKLAMSLSLNSTGHPRKKACLLISLQKATVALVGDDHFIAPVELESPWTKEPTVPFSTPLANLRMFVIKTLTDIKNVNSRCRSHLRLSASPLLQKVSTRKVNVIPLTA